MHEYTAENPDELTIEVGQIIEIRKQVAYCSLAELHAKHWEYCFLRIKSIFISCNQEAYHREFWKLAAIRCHTLEEVPSTWHISKQP